MMIQSPQSSLWPHCLKPCNSFFVFGRKTYSLQWPTSPASQPTSFYIRPPRYCFPSLLVFLFLENAKFFPSSRLHLPWSLPESFLQTLEGWPLVLCVSAQMSLWVFHSVYMISLYLSKIDRATLFNIVHYHPFTAFIFISLIIATKDPYDFD